jgi:hypothetical protein
MQQRFLLQILLLAQHVLGTTMSINRSSRVLYGGCCLWYFVLRFSSCWSGVDLRVMCPVCRMLQHQFLLFSNSDTILVRNSESTDPERSWSFHGSPKLLGINLCQNGKNYKHFRRNYFLSVQIKMDASSLSETSENLPLLNQYTQKIL